VSHRRLPSPRPAAALAAALLAAGAARAQTAPPGAPGTDLPAPANTVDSAPPFARARRLSPADLAKKRQGAFVTGLPDLSSDPVAGFGYGARVNVIWNGGRADPLFAYTPYRAKLRVGAYNTTAEQRELVLSLDVPYVRGTRWRVKVDAVAGTTPAKLYFGLTEATLGPLRLPSGGSTTYATYADYDRARKALRPGAAGEAPLVTRERQARALRRARDEVRLFLDAWEEGIPPEFAATHLQAAAGALEDLLGAIGTEDVLDRVFSQFCVGK